MATYSSVTCCEEQGSRKESYDGQKAQASVDLICDWSQRYALMSDIVGGRLAWPHSGLYAFGNSAACVPVDSAGIADGQSFDYTLARVSVNYSSGGNTPDDPVNLVSESLEPTVEFITLDHNRFVWDDDDFTPLLEKEAPGRLVRGLNIVRTYYQVEPPIPNEVLTLIGCVNNASASFSLLGITCATETLLYTPPSLNRTIKSDGSGLAFDMTHKFTYKPETWNKFYRAKTRTYEEILDIETGEVHKNFPPEDFSPLLS